MAKVNLTPELKTEYVNLFNTCVINESRISSVENIIKKIEVNKAKYEDVGNTLHIPWYFIAVIHSMESGLNFNKHLHNGDPLNQRTTHVPAGRPSTGDPPFTWEESATDALKLRKLHEWDDWSIGALLYQLEGYNGWGYRLYHQHVLSPYLWSFSNHYTTGKYVADGQWSYTAVSKQCGVAVLLRRMVEMGKIEIKEENQASSEDNKFFIRYSNDGVIEHGKALQEFLNQFPGIFLNVDGWPGKNTSDAFKKITGYHLHGDPRIDD